MMKLIQFKDFLNEALGVAMSTTFYTNRITYITIEEFYKFVDDTRESEEGVEMSVDLKLSYRDIIKLIPTKYRSEYLKFPVSEIILTIKLRKLSDEETRFGASLSRGYLVGGYASPFATGRELKATRIKDPIKKGVGHSISVHLGIEVDYSQSFRKISMNFGQFERTHLFKKVESVISHELNHLFEYYNRKFGKSEPVKTAMTWASISENVYGVSKRIFNIWQDEFTYFIYLSEPYEMNAQTQEAFTYVEKMSFEKFRRISLWQDAKKMQTWSAEEFKKKLFEEFHSENLSEDKIDEMKSLFIDEYEKVMILNKEEPSIKLEFLKKLKTDDFLKFFENRIRERGTKLIKKYCRLYALKGRI